MYTFPTLSGSVLLDGAILLFLIYLITSIRSYYRLSHIPGPKLNAHSIFPLFVVHLQGKIYNKFAEWSSSGPLVRIAPNTLLTSDPDIIRRANAARSPYTRSDWYVTMRLTPGKDTVLSTVDDNVHDDKKRKMVAAYSGKENPSLERDIDQCVQDLVDLIDRNYTSSPPEKIVRMDLARKIQYFTSDVMSLLSFDACFHDLQDDNDNFGYINEIETIFPNIFCTCTVPSVIKFLTRIGFLSAFATSVDAKFGVGRVQAITRKQIAKRFDAEGKPLAYHDDMMGSFIRHGLTRSEVEEESILQLAAGSDTTATGIRATLLCIMTNPRVEAKLTAEIQSAVASGKVPSGSVISDEQAKELPYLQACIKEGLRWHPPIVGMLLKKTPPGGDEICGYQVPGGVGIAYSAKAIHHSPDLFGPDETTFRPERWISTENGGDELSAEKIEAMKRNNDLIFGHGKYQCLGKNVAAIELNKVIFEMIRNFSFDLQDPTNAWTSSCYGIFLQKDFNVTVRRRQ